MTVVTGDKHGKLLFNVPYVLTRNDFVIVAGDFGGIWTSKDIKGRELKYLNDQLYTTLFIDGNHENFDLLKKFPIIDFHGGKARKIMPNIYHLMRGQVFDLDGKKWFTMGGAVSQDKASRLQAMQTSHAKIWWSEEMPSDSEYDEAQANLAKHDNKVDFIITHSAPTSSLKQLASWFEPDKLTNFLEVAVKQSVEYQQWFFGHYHLNQRLDSKHLCLYDHFYIAK